MKHVRRPLDYYSTPAWCVEWLLDKLVLPTACVYLEPAAGSGAIMSAVNSVGYSVQWLAVELDVGRALHLGREHPLARVINGSFLEAKSREQCQLGSGRQEAEVVIGNPPYSDALAFVTHAMALQSVQHIVYLLRLDFLASVARAPFMIRCAPDIYALSRRPSFGGGGNDMRDYAWFHWPARAHFAVDRRWERPAGTVRVLTAPLGRELFE